MRMPILLSAVAVVALFVCPVLSHIQEEDTNKNKIDVIVDGPDANSRRDFMRTKLLYLQNIFEGLTTGDFALIKKGVAEVKSITQAEQWVDIDHEHYRKLTKDFETTIERLSLATNSHNIDAVALRYYQMSTSCIDCHKHIRKVRYEY